MYQAFYKLKVNPFRMNPDPAFLCLTMQHREALAGLIYSACTRPGLTVLLGEAGTGKTTLLFSLLELLEKRRFITGLCTNPTLSRAEFYDLLLMKFGVDCGSTLKSRQLAALEATLQRSRRDGRPAILIVDEAQRLSSELLEEIRLLLNLETPGEKLLDIVVAGQPEFGDILCRPEMRQLKQRISSICRVGPLAREELKEYVDHRLRLAGLSNQTLFPDGVIDRIHHYTQGIPRLVNSLCDGALLLGFAKESAQVNSVIVDEAASDLDLSKTHAFTAPTPHNYRNFMPEAFPAFAETAMNAINKGEIAPASHGTNGNSSGHRAPDDDIARKESLNFFANLMDHLE